MAISSALSLRAFKRMTFGAALLLAFPAFSKNRICGYDRRH